MPKLAAIEGCLTALVTPFKGGKVDFDGIAKLVDWQIAEGIDGIVAVGTTGESATLDVDEHVAVIAAWARASGPSGAALTSRSRSWRAASRVWVGASCRS